MIYVELSELLFRFCMLLVRGVFCRLIHILVLRVGLYFREEYIYIVQVYIITLPMELPFYWYLLWMGCWWERIQSLRLQWWPSPIFQQHGVPYLRNHQVRERCTTNQHYLPFSLPFEPLSYLKPHHSYPFSDIVSPIHFPDLNIEFIQIKFLWLSFVTSIFLQVMDI